MEQKRGCKLCTGPCGKTKSLQESYLDHGKPAAKCKDCFNKAKRKRK